MQPAGSVGSGKRIERTRVAADLRLHLQRGVVAEVVRRAALAHPAVPVGGRRSAASSGTRPGSGVASGSSKTRTSSGGWSAPFSRLWNDCCAARVLGGVADEEAVGAVRVHVARLREHVPLERRRARTAVVAAGPAVAGWLPQVTPSSLQAEARRSASSVRPSVADDEYSRSVAPTSLQPGGTGGRAKWTSARSLAPLCDSTLQDRVAAEVGARRALGHPAVEVGQHGPLASGRRTAGRRPRPASARTRTRRRRRARSAAARPRAGRPAGRARARCRRRSPGPGCRPAARASASARRWRPAGRAADRCPAGRSARAAGRCPRSRRCRRATSSCPRSCRPSGCRRRSCSRGTREPSPTRSPPPLLMPPPDAARVAGHRAVPDVQPRRDEQPAAELAGAVARDGRVLDRRLAVAVGEDAAAVLGEVPGERAAGRRRAARRRRGGSRRPIAAVLPVIDVVVIDERAVAAAVDAAALALGLVVADARALDRRRLADADRPCRRRRRCRRRPRAAASETLPITSMSTMRTAPDWIEDAAALPRPRCSSAKRVPVIVDVPPPSLLRPPPLARVLSVNEPPRDHDLAAGVRVHAAALAARRARRCRTAVFFVNVELSTVTRPEPSFANPPPFSPEFSVNVLLGSRAALVAVRDRAAPVVRAVLRERAVDHRQQPGAAARDRAAVADALLCVKLESRTVTRPSLAPCCRSRRRPARRSR